MAEGVQGEAVPTEGIPETAVETVLPVVQEEGSAVPSVRPKEKTQPVEEGQGSGQQAPSAVPGDWWLSPAMRHPDAVGTGEPGSGDALTGWRERRVTDDDEEEWSYSTALGQYTLDGLRDRFGEPGYVNLPSRPGGTPPSRSQVSTSKFRLTSPRFKLPVAGDQNRGVPSATYAAQPAPRSGVSGPWVSGQRGGGRDATEGSQRTGQAGVTWSPSAMWLPPPIAVTFDGDPDRLAMFLGHVLSHLDRFTEQYSSPWAIVVAITASLQGEAAAWAADLFSDHARELGDVGLFLDALRARFEEPSRVQHAEAEILGLCQKGRPVREYVREFQRAAGRLRVWPERLLIHHFRRGLDKDLRRACVVRGVPPRLQDWFRIVSELDAGLREFRGSSGDQSFVRRTGARPTEVSGQPKTSTPPARPTFRCFRCNRPGHRVAECPVPALAMTPRSQLATITRGQGKPGLMQKKTPDRSRAARQTEESISQRLPVTISPTSSDEALVEYGTADTDEDPMVSQPICPFAIPISLTSPTTGHIGEFQALIDSGCTRCLVSRGVVEKLGIKIHRLARPIRFEQVDGSLLGGVPATVVTEPVRLDMNDHWELLRFIVVPSMTEDVILGLAWLDKWGPTIWWEGGSRHMRLSVGPQPLQTETGEKDKTVGGSKIAMESEEGGSGFPAAYTDLAEVFSERECDTLPPHRPTDCAIDIVPGAKLPKPRMYPMTPRELEELRQYIDKNLARGFIQPARSRIAAPVLFQEKKDGGLRLCVDFRGLNAICVEHMYPLPLMKDLLAHLAQGRVFTKLDLREAYYRVRIKSGDEWKTAFNCPLGSYQFRVMPFGLQGAPAVFMQFINGVLHEHLYRGVLVYLDDILIYTKTMEEHVCLVREVLQKLLDARLYVKLSKCEFHQSCIDYLGYRISARGVEMDPKKVQSVVEWQAPRTRRQLQSFLGFANFYRHFIPSFAAVALPLTNLLRTRMSATKPRPGQPLAWTTECQTAFEALKRLFAREPVLLHPDPEHPFVVQADASDVAVGAVLLQRNQQGELQPCAYTSRKLTETERAWAIWEKEAFAVKWALSTWRHLLEGANHQFEVWTDHKNLEVLQTPRRLSPKHVRWAQYFRRFRFCLKYIPGGKNFLADALSRLPQYDSKREQVVQAIMPPYRQDEAKGLSNHKGQSFEDTLRTALTVDPWLRGNSRLLTRRAGLAWFGNRLYIPQALRNQVLYRCHDSKTAGHFGYLKTLHLARRQFWWPRMRKDVEQYVGGCPVCASSKPSQGKPLGLLQSVADPDQPWQDIAMDFIVDLPNSQGYTVIWTVVDIFSKQAHFVPCKGLPSARKLARMFLSQIYRLHGAPRRIISDRGVQFTARFWRDFVRILGASQGLSSAYHPSTNGAAERANAAVERYLRSYVSYQQTDWADLIVFAEVAYNNAVHSSTGFTPFRVASGREFVPMPECSSPDTQPCQPGDWINRLTGVWEAVKKALIEARNAAKLQADKRRRDHKPFEVGDRVYLSTKYIRLKVPCRKLAPKYIGPFRITQVINPVTVKLHIPRFLGKVHPVFHSSLLKPVSGDQSTDAPGPVMHGQYEVQDILDSREKKGRVYYLVLWKGYPLSDASWVLETDVHAPRLLKRYHRRHPGKPGAGKGA